MRGAHGSAIVRTVLLSLRRSLRRLLRVLFVVTTTLALSLAWFVVLPFCAGSRERRRSWRRVVFGSWARAVLGICGVRVEARGALPREASFLVSNHLSYVDVLVLASLDDVVFVSMAELVRWPMIGLMARQFGTIFVQRERKRELPEVNEAIERALAEGSSIVLFAEGRASRGVDVLPFKPSLLEPAARAGHAIGWCTIHYATVAVDPPPSISVCWSDMHIGEQAARLLGLERVDATVTFGDGVVRGDDRKALARELETRVRAAFVPLRQA